MGLFSFIAPVVKGISKVLGFGSSVASTVSDVRNAFGSGQNGYTPIPGPFYGQQLGKWTNQYYNTAFPNLNEWERAGVNNPAGSIESSDITGRASENIAGNQLKFERVFKAQQLAQNERINDKNNRAQVIANTAAIGPEAQKSAVSLLEGKEPEKYVSPLDIQIYKAVTEVENIREETKLKIINQAKELNEVIKTGSEAEIAKEKVKMVERIAEAEIKKKETSTIYQSIMRAIKDASKPLDKMMEVGEENVKKYINWYNDRKMKREERNSGNTNVDVRFAY